MNLFAHQFSQGATNDTKIKPFLKWAGNKHRAKHHILPSLPRGKRLIEPFAGSCAISLATDFDSYLIADTNSDLIDMYNFIKYNIDFLVEETEKLFHQKNNNSDKFYYLRTEFNNSITSIRKSAIFIYLNRHCFNGLCRYNKSGKFNVPFGKYKSPTCPTENIIAFHKFAQKAEFISQSFQETFTMVRNEDVVYCDPPYVPLSATSNFTAYSKESFGPPLQEELAFLAELASKNGVPIIVSNHDTAVTRSLYKNARLKSFNVQRLISSKASTRGMAPELLALYGF